MSISFVIENDEGEEIEYELPSKKEVCNRCQGYGTHMNNSMGQHAYSQEEFNEVFHDDEDRRQYFTRGGIYDVTCEVCSGKNVIDVVDVTLLTEEERKIYQIYLDIENDNAEFAAMCASERRMGA
jgi:hypothetical protein